jgi:hypothetical protein
VYIGGEEVAMRVQICRSVEGVLVRLYERGNDLWRVGTLWGDYAVIQHFNSGTIMDIWSKNGLVGYFFVDSFEVEDEAKDKVHIEDKRGKKEVKNAA